MVAKDIRNARRDVLDAAIEAKGGQVQAKGVQPSERVMVALARNIPAVQELLGKQEEPRRLHGR